MTLQGQGPKIPEADARVRRLPPLLEALRPKQWTKNLLLFAGLLFTQGEPHPSSAFGTACAAFVLFCLLSGATYLINDLLDIEADRQHPKKQYRAIASGRLSVPAARLTALVLIPLTLIGAFSIGLKFGIAALSYLVLTLAYSLRLKHIVLVDVLTVSGLFVIRATAGAFAIQVPISEWLLLCTLLLALFLGLTKRRGELIALGERPATRPILAEYSLPLLDQMTTIVASACIMAYTLYTFFSQGPTGQRRPWLMATIPFVLYGLFRYLYLSHRRGIGETPEATLIEDRPLLVTVILWALTALLVLKWGPHL